MIAWLLDAPALVGVLESIGVLLMGCAAVVSARRGGDVADLRERVAKLEGRMDG